MIIFSAITPHPPIIIPGIGTKSDLALVNNTISAMDKLRGLLEASKPDTIVLISPHAPLDASSFGINIAHPLSGDFSGFGLSQFFDFENDFEIANNIRQKASENHIPVFSHTEPLDHGALVPLYFLTRNIAPRAVALSFSLLDFRAHYSYGAMLGNVLSSSKKRVAIIASGDLSHRLTIDAPAGFSEQGKMFDEKLIGFLKNNDIKGILNMDLNFIEEAGECGLRSFCILLGMLQGRYNFRVLSYEGPFGVGYLVGNYIF